MSIVKVQDFEVKPYQIPALDDEEAFESWAGPKEDEVLPTILGHKLFDLYTAGILLDPIAERWTKLLDGSTYIADGATLKYPGLRKLLVPYIYSEYVRDHWSEFTGRSVIMPMHENSVVLNPGAEICKGYNAFVKMVNQYFYGYLYYNTGIYPEWGWPHFKFKKLETINTMNL